MRIAWFTHRYHPCPSAAQEPMAARWCGSAVASGHAVDVFTSDAQDLWYFTNRKRARIDQPRIAMVTERPCGGSRHDLPFLGAISASCPLPTWPTRCRSASYMPIIPGVGPASPGRL